MSKSVNTEPEISEQTLDAQIKLATNLATTAFNHALNWPHAGSLAAVDRAIGFLQSFMPNTLHLKTTGHPAVHDCLTAILLDITMGRAKLGATPANNAAIQLMDTKNAAAIEAKQKEFRKLL